MSMARADDLPISVCAVLLAEACNVGLAPLVRPEMPALTRARLAWIQQSYIRGDTITTANNRLVDIHAALPMTKALGGGELASADGIRFVVPVRSVHAGANPKILRPWQRRDVHQLHLRRQHRLLWVRSAGHVARLDGHPGWLARAAHLAAADDP